MSLKVLSLFLFQTRNIVQNSSREIIFGANFHKVVFIVFYYMLFHSNRDEMVLLIFLGSKLGLMWE